MTTTANGATTNLARFQALLRKLFQFDCAALDFGIYRIMNHKRDAVERFITEQLPASVAAELDGGPLAQQAQASAKLGEVAQRVRATLGENAISDQGVLAAAHHELPIGQEYLEAQARAADGSRSRDAVEAAIYNHLYTFFSRYYDEGDFISKRRYSRNQRYAIPYNGEEVYLHWANSDQYYVKTDEHFRNYDWKAPNGVAVRFRLKNADVEQNNVKGDRRFFIPRISETEGGGDSAVITIPFEYRPLSGGESVTYGTTNQQDKVITDAVSAVPEQLRDNAQATAALGGEHRRDGNGPISHLEHHLRQYVRRNNSDFFIHKDLAAFLNRELDFYLKNEALNLDNLAVAGQDMAEGWFQQMRLAKAVGSKIIDFLAQIEDFQKMLWEKRKFVIETQYCITLGSIAPEFYPEIADNEAQWDEWRDLLGVNSSDRSDAFLRAHPTLVVDTRHFAAGFVDRLLASFPDLDGVIDGLLVHGDNWQAINLMEERYKGAIKCVYIDPPYNTDASAILYKNGYKDSSWLSLMQDRLEVSKHLLLEDGILCAAIDDVEYPQLQKLLQKVFAHGSSLGTAVVRSNPAGRSTPTGFSSSHEYALFFGKRPSAKVGRLPRTEAQNKRYKSEDEIGSYEWVNFRKHGGRNAYRTARPRLFYPIYVTDSGCIRVPALSWVESTGAYQIEDPPQIDEAVVWPISDNREEKTWKWGRETLEANLSDFCSRPNRVGETNIYMKSRKKGEGVLPSTWWDKRTYSASEHGTRGLINMFGNALGFSFPKAAGLVEDCVRASGCDSESIVLDYFAGSGTTGHALINLNREDGGERKFILVEMGEYFDTVLLPRIKKVTYTPEWKDGKPQRQATSEEAEWSPRIVKYLRLESYEDALDSIAFDDAAGQIRLAEASEEYLLKYMLDWETRDSDTLLNPAKLTSPFSYRLLVQVNGEKRERTVDLSETFNYLLGLKVSKREVFDDDGRRYLVFRGETRAAPGRKVAVIQRETEGWTESDFVRDRDFVAQHNLGGEADTVYVNGDSAIPGAKPIEPMFKARMFAGVNA